MKKGFIILGISILIFWLGYKYWDSDMDLGDGYYFLPEYEALDIGFPNGAIVYKSFDKNVFEDIIIPATVVEAKNRGDYIIAIQIPQNDTVKRYFVIDKKGSKIFKDLNKKEFLDICSKKGIKPL
ncbi:hypothetical protein EIB75_13025 [Epilithonimonas vandammei]|uniref:DUF3997 domain-containing protein n=1 Tax=Epilithonimonas vandammei TaxID=2487072 RepID=A0A3G8ZQ28_9FLAO|nr:hypothetical protein [Epilithonimonas vandammei]AZI56116.1 hypothetical protein EIB75_12995 [Epilithonimonas vandammei]AZI56122.1 hypothetical protein EIB75_13025 [Epilithonimonas vandammei]